MSRDEFGSWLSEILAVVALALIFLLCWTVSW